MSQKQQYHSPSTAEAFTEQNVKTIVELDQKAVRSQNWADKAADAIARFCGSMTFLWVHAGWFGSWLLCNSLPGFPHFDPYPFTFLTLVVSLEAIFLSTFILISQNHDSRIAERRNQLDLQINLLAEQENTKILRMLERMAKKLDVEVDDDPTVQVLEEATQPEELVRQIEAATAIAKRA